MGSALLRGVVKTSPYALLCAGLLGCNSDPAAAPGNHDGDAAVLGDAKLDQPVESGSGDAGDGQPDWSPARIASIPCDGIKEEWEAFLRMSKLCDSETECVVFEVWDNGSGRLTTCDRPLGLIAALNAEFLPIAQLFAERYFSPECHVDPLSPEAHFRWSAFGYDGLPMRDPRCGSSGRCTGFTPSCFGSPDSGALDSGPSADAGFDG
jgi:hypothetical protein